MTVNFDRFMNVIFNLQRPFTTTAIKHHIVFMRYVIMAVKSTTLSFTEHVFVY